MNLPVDVWVQHITRFLGFKEERELLLILLERDESIRRTLERQDAAGRKVIGCFLRFHAIKEPPEERTYDNLQWARMYYKFNSSKSICAWMKALRGSWKWNVCFPDGGFVDLQRPRIDLFERVRRMTAEQIEVLGW